MGYSDLDPAVHERRPWNAGQNAGPKRPLPRRDIWAIRYRANDMAPPKRPRIRAIRNWSAGPSRKSGASPTSLLGVPSNLLMLSHGHAGDARIKPPPDAPSSSQKCNC